MEKFNKIIEIPPLYVCSINKNGKILTSCGNSKKIFKYDSDIKIKADKLVISECPKNDLSQKTYKKLFKYIKKILKEETTKKSVYVYIGKEKGDWYEINIEKDKKNKDNVILVWFYCTYNVNFEKKDYIIKEADELEKMVITKSIELDYIIKSEKRKTEFFADLSHDLRTPLNVILGALQLVEFQMKKEKIIDEEKILDEYLGVIRFNALRLLRLVNNIIDITKLDSGFEELDLKKCNIVSLAEEVTNSVIPYMKHKEIEVVFDTDCEEIYTLIDPCKMERVMLNLLSNAIKFTNKGGTISVSVKEEENAVIYIKDNGIGIDSEKIKVIFQRFKQINNGYIRENEGSGIGLSLVKSIVDQHGGAITANSKVGEGSEFKVTLPKYKSDSNDTYEYTIGAVDLELSDICYQKYN